MYLAHFIPQTQITSTCFCHPGRVNSYTCPIGGIWDGWKENSHLLDEFGLETFTTMRFIVTAKTKMSQRGHEILLKQTSYSHTSRKTMCPSTLIQQHQLSKYTWEDQWQQNINFVLFSLSRVLLYDSPHVEGDISCRLNPGYSIMSWNWAILLLLGKSKNDRSQ